MSHINRLRGSRSCPGGTDFNAHRVLKVPTAPQEPALGAHALASIDEKAEPAAARSEKTEAVRPSYGHNWRATMLAHTCRPVSACRA
jgi:hypothetical protein